MQVKLYNTATRKKELFQLPAGQDEVRLYCCGPTVYHYAHIGNLRSYLFEDYLRRTLEYCGFNVRHVVNITDVGHLTSDADQGEDKMEKGAARTGKSVWEVAQFYTEAFMKDWDRLNIVDPTIWCKATDHIKEQISLVQKLETKGFTYQTKDGIYFDSAKFDRYPEFAKLDIENLQEGSRIDMGEKKAVTDFALWKFSTGELKRQMEWESPWGTGFPGWHVECSAMAMHHLGETLDIHCGGTDHVRVHHTNEIAQSECATGKEYSRFWMHGEFLRSGGDKMSKSSGEFLTLQLLIDKGFHPMDYRYFAANSHYRNYLNFAWEALESSQAGLRSLRKKTDPLLKGVQKPIESELAKGWRNKFKTAVADDLNIPSGLGILNSMLKDKMIADPEKASLVLEFDQVLGLELDQPYEVQQKEATLSDSEIQAQIDARVLAKANKEWAKADQIRDELANNGILLKDSPSGTTWQIK